MSKPKDTKPDLGLDTLLDMDFNTKESFLKSFALNGDETQSCINTDISVLTLNKLRHSDPQFDVAIKQLSKSLSVAKARRTKLLTQYADTLRHTLKAQSLYSPLSELYISQYASVSYDLQQLEDTRASSYYDPTAKGNLEQLVKARRSELAAILKTLIPTIKPSKPLSPLGDPLASL